MTKRLYYADPYLTRFTARVVERLTWGGHPAVVLDRTAFYPASGGQPADHGALDGAEVVDVVERDEDGAIVHVLSPEAPSRPEGSPVEGEVDWRRRFDHMQQHTGQHVLSAAFMKELNADTVGFHLGAESSTIDLDLPDLDVEAVTPVEALANQVVWEDRSVNARFVGEMRALSARRPAEVEGPIRLVEIADASEPERRFDLNPCCGTHVARTGQIGLIKIVSLEHRGDETRVEFLCGGRALRDYRAKNATIDHLTRALTVGHWELGEAVARLQDENKQLRRTERHLRHQLLDMETARLIETAVVQGPYRVIGRVWERRRPDELRTIARKLAEQPDVVALLFSVGQRAHFCFARSEGLALNVEELLQEACAALDGKGGGRPQAAQGSAPATDLSRVEAVLSDLQSTLAAG